MGKIYVVGIGPGAYEQMTIKAVRILEQCQVIVGYTVYVDLVREHFPEKLFLSTPMKREAERCREAFMEAVKGQQVAMICSGDAGIYGLAGLMYEVGSAYPDIKIEVVAGVTAASAGAAVLGAPLIHDCALISLSDLLTPWDKIEQRLRLSAEADFVICLYNPSSKKRSDYLYRACEILMESKSPDTICGTVRNIGRAGEESHIFRLEELKNAKVDMFTTVFIGNEETKRIAQNQGYKMVTPRGYTNV